MPKKTKQPYAKKHETYVGQIEILRTRGLLIGNEDRALEVLKRIGYYRFSAYLYPMRELLVPNPTKHEYRKSEFVKGATFEDALALYDFDVQFRAFLGNAIGEVELALRAQLAYVLGAVDKNAHVSPLGLDLSGTEALKQANRWMGAHSKCERLAARTEPYEHFRDKYSDLDVPIWIMIETLDLGGLIALFDSAKIDLRNRVSREFGVTQGKKLSKWLPNLRSARNVWGHHGRAWNARFSYPVSDLEHVDSRLPKLSDLQQRKAYATLALLAILLEKAGLDAEFRHDLFELMEQLPQVTLAGGDVETAMGFPHGWRLLDFWAKE